MASTTNDEEVGWGLIDASQATVGGWSTLVFEALQQHALCACCCEMNVGCLCEDTALYYEMQLAQRAYEKAKNAYWSWFDVHRRPQIDAENAEWEREQRREQRRWKQFHNRRRRAFYKRMKCEAAKKKEEEQANAEDMNKTPENEVAEVVIDENEAEHEEDSE